MALTDNLQAFYKLSDTSDSSGNNRTLTNNGNVTFAPGKIGDAAFGDGTGYLISSLDQPQNAMSISTWFKTSASGQIELCGFADNSGLGFGLLLAGGNFTSFICSSDSPPWQIDVSGNWTDDTWHHAVLSWDGSVAKTFVDGVLGGSENITGSPNNGLGSGFNILRLGEGQAPAANTMVDAVGIWNRALNDAEVAELYNNGTGLELDGVPQPTLVKLQAPVKFMGKVKFGV